jgi:ferredoxin
MPRFLNTRGNTTLAIGICGRCSIKMPLDQLLPDPNSPGLLVCEKDRDQYDPYRLPLANRTTFCYHSCVPMCPSRQIRRASSHKTASSSSSPRIAMII